MRSFYSNKNENIRNNCNEFIVKHLQRIKSMAYQTRNDRKFAIYNTAIHSIKKYPLPLICSLQLKMLSGIGDRLSQQITKLIKIHYKSFLNSKVQTNQINNSLQKEQSKNQQGYPNNNQLDPQENDSQNQNGLQLKSVKSAIVARTYKPRPNTNAATLLIALCKMSTKDTYLNKKDIQMYIKNQMGQVIKGWTSIQQNLQFHGYINVAVDNKMELMVTEKGRQFVIQINQKSVISSSKTKVMSEVNNFRSQIKQMKLEKIEEQSENQKEMKKYLIKYNRQSQLVLIIDSRQMKNQSQRSFFLQKLSEKHNINCKIGALSIGDFAWTLDGQILDYIVERKKADDLAASIIDGRYKQQKYRLKQTQIKNIFYLFEGHPSTNCIKNEKQLENALLKTRIKQKFKVIRTKTINQSLKFLTFLHNQLLIKIKNGQQLETMGDLTDFNRQNSKRGSLTVQLFFGLGIKCFPGVGKVNVGNLIKYFKTFKTIHDKLNEFETQAQKIQFIRQLLKKSRTPINFPKLLVQLLFHHEYK